MRFWSLLLAGVAAATPLKRAQLASRDITAPADRAAAIKEAFTHSWNGYSKFAFGHDELLPVTNQPQDSR